MSTIKSSSEHLTLNADGASKDIKFQSNGVEKASIDSSGNLTVSGNLTSVGIDDNADATAITIDSSENVGIGTSSPNYKLKIIGGADILNLENTSASSYEHLRFTVGSANARIVMTGESFGDANYGQGDLTLQTETSGGKIRFGTGASGVNKMIIGDDGISFNGDTAAANALDDYEEGTWTPAIVGGTLTIDSIQSANYVKIGKLVYIDCYIRTDTADGDATHMKMSGLPYTVQKYGTGTSINKGNTGGTELDNPHFRFAPNSTTFSFFRNFKQANLNQNDIHGDHIIFSGTYRAA